jgi:hypothetical protein
MDKCIDCGQQREHLVLRCPPCEDHIEDGHEPRGFVIVGEREDTNRRGQGEDSEGRVEFCHGAGPYGILYSRLPIPVRELAATRLSAALKALKRGLVLD